MRFRKLRIAWSVVWGTIFFTMLVGRLKELFGGIHYPTMPSDILIALTALLAIAPIKGTGVRFSLRTLLIVTTMVAVALGLAVYTFKKPASSRLPAGYLCCQRTWPRGRRLSGFQLLQPSPATPPAPRGGLFHAR